MTGQPSASERADGRRTGTRDRIHEVALEVFLDRGYDKATLREIAERLQITRPALYYHYKSKEDILASIHHELALSIDGILEWARDQPPTAGTRIALLERLADLMAGPWGAFMRFAQANETAMRDLTAAADFIKRTDTLAVHLSPDDTVSGRIRGRLALAVLFMAGPRARQLGGTARTRRAAALDIATQLVS